MASRNGTADSLAVSVHGSAGVLDLVVPPQAAAADLAREYARQTGLSGTPQLYTRTGAPLAPQVPLAGAGVGTGAVLVAAEPAVPPATRRASGRAVRRTSVRPAPGAEALSALWFCVAAGAALLAGWCATRTSSGAERTVAIDLLVAGAVLGVLPVGRLIAQRAIAAPAFAAAAALALAWDPHPERLPMVVGIAALAAALAAAVARALDRQVEEALRVWIIAGALVFLVAGLGALAGAPPRLCWSLLLVVAVLAARFVPGLAVDVPDQYLIDLERLAVTAWSAREQPIGRRGRSVVPRGAVAVVAGRGTRLVTAAGAAVLAVAVLAAPLLLATATQPIDRIGARCLVGLAGASLLLAARSYRHVAARALLRTAGLGCWAALAVVVLDLVEGDDLWWIVVPALLLTAILVVVAVAAGRGWRSAWWSRRAEVAEGLSGALALASLVVAAGWFRQLWEMASLWELSS